MIKRCKMCGVVIADQKTCDAHRWASLKYCDECRKISDEQNTAKRLREMRKRRTESYKMALEHNNLLREENELLRLRIAAIRNGNAL